MPVNSEIASYLRQHGSHCMAYTTLEPSMESFVVEGVGYISYISFKHWFWARSEYKVVLADPVCAVENYQEIVSQFINKYTNVIFVEASPEFASVLDTMGYQVNQFGIETDIHLAGFNMQGKLRAKLRQWKNKCLREGVDVEERLIESCDNHHEIKQLSYEWLSKKGDEYRFLVRPLRFENEKDVRYFWAYQNQKLVAFALFDPIYQDGKVIAYYHNTDRMSKSAPHGTSAFIILSAIEMFKKEGLQFISLGMSPLCLQEGMGNEIGKDYNLSTRKAFWYAFKNLNFLYPFKGNASHKNKFNGERKPIYFSSTEGTGLWVVFVMMKAIGLF